MIAVSSTNATDTFSAFSSQGPEVCVSAPGGYGGYWDGYVLRFNGPSVLGKNILSTTPNYTFNIAVDPYYSGDPYSTDVTQNYGYMPGTSMAAPHVSGIAALILSANPNLAPSQIRNIIQQSAEDKGTAGFDNYYGYGRVNAYGAVLATMKPTLTVTRQAFGANYRPKLDWTFTASGVVDGYYIYRYVSEDPGSGWVHIATTYGNTKTYTDVEVVIRSGTNPNLAQYKVQAFDSPNFLSDFSNIASIGYYILLKESNEQDSVITQLNQSRPISFILREAYPNPFNQSTRIAFEIGETAPVKIIIYDLLGRQVRTLVNHRISAGTHEVQWNGRDESEHPLSSGIYFCQMLAGNKRQTIKLLLAK